MATYLLIDSMNMFFRGAHSSPGAPIDMATGMALHVILSSIRSSWNRFDATHVVYCQEGRSWRKDHYSPYKANRIVAKLAQSEAEQERGEILFETLQELDDFIINKTNATVLQNDVAEADDMIAFFIQSHPDDEHVIVSTDTDFLQLLKHKNVSIFDGVQKRILHQSGITNDKGKTLEFSVKSDGKLKVGKADPSFVPAPDWYEFAMFIKMIRGDKSDNIFSAYPGARLKGTKNKIGITEAFEDRHKKGFTWNNFMLRRWEDHNEEEQQVKTAYERNQTLIDLEKQPDEVKISCLQSIMDATNKPPVSNVGIYFMKFCGLHALNRLSDNPNQFANMFNKRYPR